MGTGYYDVWLREASRGVYQTGITFFRPRPAFIEYMKRQHARRFFVDCGAGLGTMSKALETAGLKGVAIDQNPSSEAVVQVVGFDAEDFDFTSQMTPIIARPCRGRWIRDTIDNGVKGAGYVLYIGLRKHVAEDLTPLPYPVSMQLADAGEDGECVWLIGKRDEDIVTDKSFERVVLIKIDGRGPSHLVGIKDGEKYWDCDLGHDPFVPETDIIVNEFAYENDADLDGIFSALDAAKAPDPQEPCARLGWISPEGYFFPCRYVAHKELARLLVARYLDGDRSFYGADDTLEKRGWLKINGGGTAYRRVEGSWPQPMLDTFAKIVQAFKEAKAKGVNFNNSLRLNPEGYAEPEWGTIFPDGDNNIVEQLEQEYRFQMGEVETYELVVPPDIVSRRLDEHPGD